MRYNHHKLLRHSKVLDDLWGLARRAVTGARGEGWWRYRRGDKEAELRALLANLATCVHDSDGSDELAVSRDKNAYRRGLKRRMGRGYAVTVPLIDDLVATNFCLQRHGWYDHVAERGRRTRLRPTAKAFLGRADHAALRCPDERPVWEVRDEEKKPVEDYTFTTEEQAQIAELETYNEFMAGVTVEVPPLRLVVEVASRRVRAARHLRGEEAARFHVPLEEVLACGAEVVELFSEVGGDRVIDADAVLPTFYRPDAALALDGTSPPTDDVVVRLDRRTVDPMTDHGTAALRPTAPPMYGIPRRPSTEPPSNDAGAARPEAARRTYVSRTDYGPPGGHYSVVFPNPSFLWPNPRWGTTTPAAHLLPVQVVNRRIFNRGSTDYGGRHYNPGQLFSLDERRLILIGGEPTVELDYRGLHLNMCYHLLGLRAPFDPYRIYGDHRDDLARAVVKQAVLILINANGKNVLWTLVEALQTWSRGEWLGFKAFRENVEPLSALLERIKRFHAPIAEFFNSDIGVRLQRQDSAIMRLILNRCMALGIAAIPVHDSVVVARRHERSVHRIMRDAYRDVMRAEIVVERK